ncbi:hypothetical protein BV22DRAFT_1040831 [Leucogyrophana mollusca]|uniref:Uncharacterized protein n=1 Tax=Leucogyrophana mollusca TaxID=85980 RepID=A0ACB8B427_9AGAM|nr:hypothetical protein BV22DRAFT_1040831 [Leucogyrophana mollusca]
MENKLALISESLYSRVPYCSGIRAIPAHQFLLYYGRDSDQCQRVDLSRPSTTQMQALVKACEPATFGRDQEDVLDETYRKAGKLDTPAFATLFSAENAGLVDIIRANLLQGDIEKRDIRLEMYKLNVYGKDSFFKAHKDTPRGEDMFGSLVIVFPTPHEGGALVIRQDAKEWTVDVTEAFAEASEPSIGYIAFYSDVEHEVALVKSGYRVTLTYNLYFTGDERQDFPPPVPYVAEEELKALLVDLLSDEGVLPDGGYIGFGLQYQYPVSTGTKLRKLRKCLKGNDALLGRVCDALNFEWFIRVLYRGAGLSRWRKAHVLTDRSSTCRNMARWKMCWTSWVGKL